ncbi:pyrroloquinoline quinone biosynthesis peptide chaperone PqqD [Polaromonas sp. CG_9.11]|uniref:pyrroloquinoline quinone biosynthesis peptide chaperone PqqD n=1 Tax=Polaromonas sp. CG_9.11 TaxID=2787730 RepID=UPI0018C9753F|nr:pyrroloquinoline quinone biosynthesis peptide chaperone PqqD [Polaromonas sp. CG_9.11]MBG6074603.1 pyrroloquinoline quinone biosynthesis protein D [Polaromonas sp. CG_9.11]
MNAAPALPTLPLSPVAPEAKAPNALPPFPRLSRLYRLQYEPVQSAWVLLYPEGMVKLNDSSAEILRRCNGERSVDAMVAELEILFNAQGIAPQVTDLLQEGMRRGWIV